MIWDGHLSMSDPLFEKKIWWKEVEKLARRVHPEAMAAVLAAAEWLPRKRSR